MTARRRALAILTGLVVLVAGWASFVAVWSGPAGAGPDGRGAGVAAARAPANPAPRDPGPAPAGPLQADTNTTHPATNTASPVRIASARPRAVMRELPSGYVSA